MFDISKVKEVVHLSTDVGLTTCRECGELNGKADFDVRVNHYIGHGYRVLHIGQETCRDGKGAPWHSTVAVMGK